MHLFFKEKQDSTTSFIYIVLRFRKTLIRYSKEMGFGSYFSAHKPALTEKYRKTRLRWSKERTDRIMEDWSKDVWSDELRFKVEGDSGRYESTWQCK